MPEDEKYCINYLDTATVEPGRLVMAGCWKGPMEEENWLTAPVSGEGMRFQAVLLALPEGGHSAVTSITCEQGDIIRLNADLHPC